MKKFLTIAALAVLSSQAHAELFNFTGNITYNTDVIQINFTLDQDATDVRLWTDSFQSGQNFDPIIALWDLTTGALIAQNDDNLNVGANQTYWDAGIVMRFLAAGDYALTIAAYNNSGGSNLSDPFNFALWGTPQMLIGDWFQPSNGTGKGSYWSVWLDGVDSARNANDPGNVPEPASLLLAALGLSGLASFHRRRRKIS